MGMALGIRRMIHFPARGLQNPRLTAFASRIAEWMVPAVSELTRCGQRAAGRLVGSVKDLGQASEGRSQGNRPFWGSVSCLRQAKVVDQSSF